MNSPPAPREPQVNKPFRLVTKMQATELHLKADEPAMLRLRGDIRRMEMRPLTQENLGPLLHSILWWSEAEALAKHLLR
jgi:twitching motility protein PilT